jgi:ABC-type antimicrobial peptide transport system permease subunit
MYIFHNRNFIPGQMIEPTLEEQGNFHIICGQAVTNDDRPICLLHRLLCFLPGTFDMRIMTRHVLPNILGPIIVSQTLIIPAYIATEAFLSFIGLGVLRPTPSWGAMIVDGSEAIRTYPHQAIFPAIALAITMFAFNFLGDGLRDALDPRLQGTE